MKKYLFLFILTTCLSSAVSAQKAPFTRTTTIINERFSELSFGIGNKQSSVVAGYFYNWNIRKKKLYAGEQITAMGKSKSFIIGTGLRISSNFGKGSLYTSAPSALAGDVNKTDTLFTSSPTMVGMNVLINLGYNITPKLQAGFNIDVIGFTVGAESKPTAPFNPSGFLISSAKPTPFNILLVGNNDRGTLNSELYARYKITNKFGVKLAYQYLFTELTTNTKVQTTPEANDRFRNKSRLINIGFSYHF
jgi:hypothetical protein